MSRQELGSPQKRCSVWLPIRLMPTPVALMTFLVFARKQTFRQSRRHGQTLPWIPSDEQWRGFLEIVRHAPLRTRCMVALAYDAGLRRKELCSLSSTDLDPAHRMVRVRAEIAKGSRERVVPYSATTGELLRAYLVHRRTIAHTRALAHWVAATRRKHDHKNAVA